MRLLKYILYLVFSSLILASDYNSLANEVIMKRQSTLLFMFIYICKHSSINLVDLSGFKQGLFKNISLIILNGEDSNKLTVFIK